MVMGMDGKMLEFTQKSVMLLKANNPLLSKDKRRKIFRDFVDSLSQGTFEVYFPQILTKVIFSEKSCRKYANSEIQLAEFLKWLPRFEPYKDIVLGEIRERRKEYGLVE